MLAIKLLLLLLLLFNEYFGSIGRDTWLHDELWRWLTRNEFEVFNNKTSGEYRLALDDGIGVIESSHKPKFIKSCVKRSVIWLDDDNWEEELSSVIDDDFDEDNDFCLAIFCS